MKCPNCKKEITAGQAFCPACGRKVGITSRGPSEFHTSAPHVSHKPIAEKNMGGRTRIKSHAPLNKICDFIQHNERLHGILAAIAIVTCIAIGVYIRVDGKQKHRRAQENVLQYSRPHIGTRTNFLLGDHSQSNLNPISAQLNALYDFSQTPRGVRGLRPCGRTHDGRPIFDDMPVYDEVPEAFVATVCYPGVDPYLPTLSHKVNVPARGKDRNAFRRKIEDDFRSCQASQILYMISDERRSKEIQNEMGKLEWQRKSQEIRQKAHEFELSHISNMTRDQYLKVQQMDLKRMDNGNPHTDMFYDKRGDLFKVDVNGNAYRYTQDGRPLFQSRRE